MRLADEVLFEKGLVVGRMPSEVVMTCWLDPEAHLAAKRANKRGPKKKPRDKK